MIKNAFILNFLKLYNILWRFALPLLRKNRRLRQGFEQRRSARHLSPADIWIQAASAGEAYLAVEIANTLKCSRPLRLLVTCMTLQGKEILEKHLGRYSRHSLAIEWFPFDIPEVMQAAVKKIRPKVIVLLETEIWPALLFYARTEKIPVAVINARLSAGSFMAYSATSFLWKHLTPRLVLATSQQDAQRFAALFDTARVETMHNIKFETLGSDDPAPHGPAPVDMPVPRSRPLTILASIRRQEEAQVVCIIKALLKAVPEQTIAVFPRHMHRIAAWKNRLKKNGLPFVCRSETSACSDAYPVILWDTFGELKAAYASASAVFVGGSLKPLGGQNFLEPALYGVPTVTGPWYDDFAWVGKGIFQLGVLHRADDWQTAAELLIHALTAPGDSKRFITAITAYVKSRSGGTKKACSHILQLTDEGP